MLEGASHVEQIKGVVEEDAKVTRSGCGRLATGFCFPIAFISFRSNLLSCFGWGHRKSAWPGPEERAIAGAL